MKQVSLLLLMVSLLAGCAPKVSEEIPGGCVPYDIQVEPNHEKLTIIWKNDCPRLISGYNIYISSQPNSEKPFNKAVYPGDTNPDDDLIHFDANDLTNGVKYFVSVRTVFPDLSESRPSKQITTACGVRGEIKLSVRYRSDQDGYSFERGQYVRADDLTNDLYFLHKDGKDYLASPNRLDGFLRSSKLSIVAVAGDYGQVRDQLVALTIDPSEDRIMIESGQWIMLGTSDGATAFLRVLGFTGEAADREVGLYVVYSSTPGVIIL